MDPAACAEPPKRMRIRIRVAFFVASLAGVDALRDQAVGVDSRVTRFA
jgi:hypothetical protein